MTESVFRTTRWSLVTQARSCEVDEKKAALEQLCRAYWYPLFAYLRRSGRDAERAGDLVQGLFAKLLEKDSMGTVRPGQGRFRDWLLTCLRNHERDLIDHERAHIRDAGGHVISIDTQGAEQRYGLEDLRSLEPEGLFELAWAREVLAEARRRLGEEYAHDGRQQQIDVLGGTIEAGTPGPERARMARELGLGSVALRVAVHRFRRRYRAHVLAALRDTLGDEGELGSELSVLTAALSGSNRAPRG